MSSTLVFYSELEGTARYFQTALTAPLFLIIVNVLYEETNVFTLNTFASLILYCSGAPNDGFLPNALKRCFRLSGGLLKLCRLILGCAIKFLSVRFF